MLTERKAVFWGFFVAPLRCLFSVVALLAILASGCSSGARLVRVKGQLMYNQKPLPVSPKTGITVWFTAVDAGDNPPFFTAEQPFNREDSTFVVAGHDGRGIPIGKYRIAVSQKMAGQLPPDVETMNETFSRKSSPIIREVTSEEPIILDLSKPEG
jgi:hypothetical protein